MPNLDQVRELRDLYAGFDASEIEEMFQIASADLAEVKRRVRDGLASRAELNDARNDFAAIRGLRDGLARGAV